MEETGESNKKKINVRGLNKSEGNLMQTGFQDEKKRGPTLNNMSVGASEYSSMGMAVRGGNRAGRNLFHLDLVVHEHRVACRHVTVVWYNYYRVHKKGYIKI